MNASFEFTGKKVFLIGGTSGINLGIAEAFAKRGAVMGVASRHPEKVRATVARLMECGRLAGQTAEPQGYILDVRDAQAVAEAISAFAAMRGSIDVLVSGAAGNFPAAAQAQSPNGFKSVVDIDLLGTFHVMRGAHPHLRSPGASVINISARHAVIAMPMQVHVCAVKAGVDMVTRTLAIEWGLNRPGNPGGRLA